MRLFKKDKRKLSEIEIEISKYPRSRRKKLMDLYTQYNKGLILQPGKDIDNKKYILDKR
jgi:hypothetical protein